MVNFLEYIRGAMEGEHLREGDSKEVHKVIVPHSLDPQKKNPLFQQKFMMLKLASI